MLAQRAPVLFLRFWLSGFPSPFPPATDDLQHIDPFDKRHGSRIAYAGQLHNALVSAAGPRTLARCRRTVFRGRLYGVCQRGAVREAIPSRQATIRSASARTAFAFASVGLMLMLDQGTDLIRQQRFAATVGDRADPLF